MRLHINAFKATVNTDIGKYGVFAEFDNGLNVIRAENTSGKSSLVNGIFYALGLEIIIGKRGIEAVKPVFRYGGEWENFTFNVIESYVELEIKNNNNQIITIRRYIKSNKDPKLIQVIFGPILTSSNKSEVYNIKSYFVGIEGAAQRENGFHYFLADFLKLDLPYVKKFSGSDVPLYVECISPLMFIEQIRGWSGIQATLPQGYGIINAAKVAVEYLLGLEVIKNEMLRLHINDEATKIREEWRSIKDSMTHSANSLGGRVINLHSSPVSILTEEPYICITVDDDNTVNLDVYIIEKRKLLIELQDKTKDSPSDSKDKQDALGKKQNALFVSERELSQLQSDFRQEEFELKRLTDRLCFIKDDIQRNKDVQRLRDLGMETELSLLKDKCPTCNQSVQDSLIPMSSGVMDIQDNINFLKAENEAVELLISAGKERMLNQEAKIIQLSNNVSNLRKIIRDLRSDLLSNKKISTGEIREQILLQEEIATLENTRAKFANNIKELNEVVIKWSQNRARHSNIPKEYFSDIDKLKLKYMSDKFTNNVFNFGYRSTGLGKLHISTENYRPVLDEFEVAFAASASDNIRLIWAYTLALLQTSIEHNTNHWGLIIYDEPEQQQMKEASSDSLYKEIASIPSDKFQVIIATSAPVDITTSRLKNLPHKLIEFGDKVVRPVDS